MARSALPARIRAQAFCCADGQMQANGVLPVADAIEALGIDPYAAAVIYWRTVGNRLAARLPLPAYTAERHAAHLGRWALR